MKFLRYSSFAVVLTVLVFLGCKRENSATLIPSAEEKLSEAAVQLTELSKPSVVCDVASPTSISLNYCAGPSGAPAGFTVTWMTQPDFFNNGGDYFADSDPRLCKATFTGAKYILGPNQCVVINIGEALQEAGVTSNCTAPLSCVIAKYVFRGYNNATATLPRSVYSEGRECSTLPCPPTETGCTFTQGYWKNHGPVGCASGNNKNKWPVSSLVLGTVTYTDAQLCSIFKRQVAGNGLIALAHQLIAAKLNIANGSSSSTISSTLAAADALIGGLVVPPVGTGSLSTSATSGLIDKLTKYNEGLLGPGHCE
jgi:hypothetical protein